MIINVSKLKDGESLDVEHVYDPKELNVENCDVHYLAPLSLQGRIERIQNAFFFKGNLATKLELTCTRCLKDVTQDSNEPFDLYFPVTRDENIDATNEIREVMILSYPVKFLCAETCKGLCAQCGKNLNMTKCKCATAEGPEGFTGSFDKLKEWHKTKNKNRKGRK